MFLTTNKKFNIFQFISTTKYNHFVDTIDFKKNIYYRNNDNK